MPRAGFPRVALALIVGAALAACGIERDRRPQTLAVGEWIALAEAFGTFPGEDAQ